MWLPGIIPVYTVKTTKMLAKVCGTSSNDEFQGKLDELAKSDKDEVLNFGIDFAVEQYRELVKKGVARLHLYTMNRSKSTTEIITRPRK